LESGYCDRTLQLLLKTFIDIILLKKGPEHVPGSWMILILTVGLMIGASFTAMVLIDPQGQQDHVGIFVSSLIGIAFYAAILIITGNTNRSLPTLSAIIGCSSLLTLLFVTEYVLFRPFLGTRIAGIVATLIVFWSVPVEGHIIARAIGQHWFVGIAIAVAAFILQLSFQTAFTGQT
jgi:hypothetical protein